LELSIDHVAIAVRSITDAMPVLELIVGASGSPVERVEAQGVDVAFLGGGPTVIELIQPVSETSAVARFLDRRGPGLHHIAFRVADLERTLDRLADQGVELIDRTPRPGAKGHRVAFLHPRAVGGVLVELVEGAVSASP
jgi:methylmalonyl-CoA/ethylmalonyl-CoA epimerase